MSTTTWQARLSVCQMMLLMATLQCKARHAATKNPYKTRTSSQTDKHLNVQMTIRASENFRTMKTRRWMCASTGNRGLLDTCHHMCSMMKRRKMFLSRELTFVVVERIMMREILLLRGLSLLRLMHIEQAPRQVCAICVCACVFFACMVRKHTCVIGWFWRRVHACICTHWHILMHLHTHMRTYMHRKLCPNWEAICWSAKLFSICCRQEPQKHHTCKWLYVCMYVCICCSATLFSFCCRQGPQKRHTCKWLYVCMYVCMYVASNCQRLVTANNCVKLYVCMRVCMHACMQRVLIRGVAWREVCVAVCMHVCMHVCMYVNVWVHVLRAFSYICVAFCTGRRILVRLLCAHMQIHTHKITLIYTNKGMHIHKITLVYTNKGMHIHKITLIYMCTPVGWLCIHTHINIDEITLIYMCTPVYTHTHKHRQNHINIHVYTCVYTFI